MTDLRRMKLSRVDGNATLLCEVSPCCFMYPNYGLQITVEIEGGGRNIKRGGIQMSEATAEHVQALFDSVRLTPCTSCGMPTFDPTTIKANPECLCLACISKTIDPETEKALAEFDAQYEAQVKAERAKAKAKGFTHEVRAWIHCDFEGDYEVVFYTKTDAKPVIQAVLKSKGSQMLDDYVVTLI